MKLHGWCSKCHRVRMVTVSGHSLAMAASARGVPSGVCDECARERDVTRKITARYGHTWEADIRIAGELAGNTVRSVSHDPAFGYTILLDDGRELEARTPSEARAKLYRLPRRR